MWNLESPVLRFFIVFTLWMCGECWMFQQRSLWRRRTLRRQAPLCPVKIVWTVSTPWSTVSTRSDIYARTWRDYDRQSLTWWLRTWAAGLPVIHSDSLTCDPPVIHCDSPGGASDTYCTMWSFHVLWPCGTQTTLNILMKAFIKSDCNTTNKWNLHTWPFFLVSRLIVIKGDLTRLVLFSVSYVVCFSGLSLACVFSVFLICLLSCIFQHEWHCVAWLCC